MAGRGRCRGPQNNGTKATIMSKFFRKEDGLVTIEWVGIAAVMVLAAVAITAYIVESADGAGG